MRTIGDIYEEFRIPPWLQIHQLRVAAVGKFVTEIYPGAIRANDVISACLLHDMGAIVKFDFSRDGGVIDSLYPLDEVAYWQGVQRDMRETYGELEHPATDAILKEIGVSESIVSIVHNTGFSNMPMMIVRNLIDVQIVQYADMRVAPRGITSLKSRLFDVKERYAEKLKASGWYENFDENIARAESIEEMLFVDTSAQPEDITEEGVQSDITELRNFRIL